MLRIQTGLDKTPCMTRTRAVHDPVLWEAPIALEGFQQHGETEPGGAHLVAEQCALVQGECPVLGEFIRVPVLLHDGRGHGMTLVQLV
jgi:hypothetical protein